MCDFEVVYYNVNGLGDDRKRRKIFNYMKKHTSGKAISSRNSFSPKSRKAI